MGRVIVKPVKNKDFYVEYCSIVDMPVAWGSRGDFLGDYPDWEPRLDRADLLSTSALYYTGTWHKDRMYMYAQYGMIPRSRLREITDIYEKMDIEDQYFEDDPRILELLTDFED